MRRVLPAVGLVAVAAGCGMGSSHGAGTSATTPTRSTAPPTTTTPATTEKVVLAAGETLKVGSSGAQVTHLQKALTTLGYDPGKADGSFGPQTQAAVQKFQTAKNLPADGVVGPQTAAAINEALAAKNAGG